MLVLYINSKRKVIEEESLKKQQQLTKLSTSLLLATSSIPLTNNNKDNIVLSCLECNLKRRNKNKDSFLFTKQLKIVRENIDK